MAKADKVYKNKNGNMDVEDFIRLIHKGDKGFEQYMRDFKTTKHPCPPLKLISNNQQCFFCIDCLKYCKNQVKEYKNYYKVGSKKYPKEEFDEDREC